MTTYLIRYDNKNSFALHSNVTDENLRFLTPQQALADTAHFINHIQTTVPGASNSPFILVGGHYSASLAVWFRQAFPHLTLGNTWKLTSRRLTNEQEPNFRCLGIECSTIIGSGLRSIQSSHWSGFP